MSHFLMLASLLVVGAVEWGLAIRRAVYAARGARWRCAAVVFCENLLAIGVLCYIVRESSFWPLLAYAIGGAAGAWWAARR